MGQNNENNSIDIDGIVIKLIPFNLTKLDLQQNSRWAIAYKFKAEQARTRLLRYRFKLDEQVR